MVLRLRRTWSVLPGIRFNLGLRSGSVSFGMRGLHYTVGTRGSRVTVGIPGSGLFWTKKLHSSVAPAQPRQRIQTQSPPTGAQTQPYPRTVPGAAQTQTISPHPVGRAQTQAVLPAIAHGSTLQLRQPQTPSPTMGGALTQRALAPQNPARSTISGQPLSPKYTHFFLPAWLIWAVATVLFIAGLCVTAAVIGDGGR
jgi:hypothetical protein